MGYQELSFNEENRMSRTIVKSLGLGFGVLALSACNPYQENPGVVLDLDNNSVALENVPLDFTAKFNLTGDFSLVASPCDASAVTVDYDHEVLVPAWNPYDCTEDGGAPSNPTEGNIQFFVDGIFMGIHTSTDVPVELAPKGDDSDLKFGFYVDGGDDFDGDGVNDSLLLCHFYFPQDNLGLARKQYEEFMYYLPKDVGYAAPGNVYDLFTGDQIAESDQAPDGYVAALYYGAYSWTTFEYLSVGNDEALIEGYHCVSNGSCGDPDTTLVDPRRDGAHVFYGELHYNNHSPVPYAGRERIITKTLDLSGMPDDWCGNKEFQEAVFGADLGLSNPGLLY